MSAVATYKKGVEKSYDLICDEWQKFRNSTVINKCIVDFGKYLAPHGKILDIGCGTGCPVARYFSERGFYVTGIDISQNMIDKANGLQLENVTFIKKDIADYSTDIRFDGVVAFDSIWHIAKEKQAEVYGKISSLMNTGAYFLFTHGNRDGETVGTMYGQKFYYAALSVDELTATLSEAGLKIISLTENYKEQSTGERDLLVIAKKFEKRS